MTENEDTKGYTSVTLKEFLKKVDEESAKSGMNNRSLVIRLILQAHFDLKDRGVDLLKIDDMDEFVKKVKG